MGIPPPDHIVVGLAPNFWVTEADAETTEGTLRGQTMYLSLPLLRLLSLDQVRAILAHELAHFVGADTSWSRRFAPIWRGTVDALLTLRASSSGLSAVAAIPAHSVLSHFLASFASAHGTISRERELSADQVAVRIAGAAAFGSALVRVALAARAWEPAVREFVPIVAAGQPLPNLGVTFAGLAAAGTGADPVVLSDLDSPPHPTDSHPPTSDRLAAIGIALDDTMLDLTAPMPTDAGHSLFDAGEAIEMDLTAMVSAMFSPQAREIAEAIDRENAAVAWLDAKEREAAQAAAQANERDGERRAAEPPRLAAPVSCTACGQLIYRVATTCWSCGAAAPPGARPRSAAPGTAARSARAGRRRPRPRP